MPILCNVKTAPAYPGGGAGSKNREKQCFWPFDLSCRKPIGWCSASLLRRRIFGRSCVPLAMPVRKQLQRKSTGIASGTYRDDSTITSVLHPFGGLLIVPRRRKGRRVFLPFSLRLRALARSIFRVLRAAAVGSLGDAIRRDQRSRLFVMGDQTHLPGFSRAVGGCRI